MPILTNDLKAMELGLRIHQTEKAIKFLQAKGDMPDAVEVCIIKLHELKNEVKILRLIENSK